MNANLATPSLVGTFVPPAVPFKFKLSGRTVAGQSFQRISRKLINAKNILLRLQSTQRYDTLECGKYLRLPFVIDYNGARGETFDVIVESSLKITNSSKSAIEIRYRKVVQNIMQDREAFFTVLLKTPRDVTGILGKWDTIKVTVKKTPVSGAADVVSFTEHFKVTCFNEFEP